MMMYGDNVKNHPRWSKIRQGGVDYAEVLKAAGGSVDIYDLPDMGLKGNSHMIMMDKNSDQVADLIQKWLVGKGLGIDVAPIVAAAQHGTEAAARHLSWLPTAKIDASI